MKFYSTLLKNHYGIGLSPKASSMIEALFTAASHHFARGLENGTDEQRCFHHQFMWRHFDRIFSFVSEGEFANLNQSQESVIRGLNAPENWRPERILRGMDLSRLGPDLREHLWKLPEPHPLEEGADPKYLIGEQHPFDILLERHDLDPSQIMMEEGAA